MAFLRILLIHIGHLKRQMIRLILLFLLIDLLSFKLFFFFIKLLLIIILHIRVMMKFLLLILFLPVFIFSPAHVRSLSLIILLYLIIQSLDPVSCTFIPWRASVPQSCVLIALTLFMRSVPNTSLTLLLTVDEMRLQSLVSDPIFVSISIHFWSIDAHS